MDEAGPRTPPKQKRSGKTVRASRSRSRSNSFMGPNEPVKDVMPFVDQQAAWHNGIVGEVDVRGPYTPVKDQRQAVHVASPFRQVIMSPYSPFSSVYGTAFSPDMSPFISNRTADSGFLRGNPDADLAAHVSGTHSLLNTPMSGGPLGSGNFSGVNGSPIGQEMYLSPLPVIGGPGMDFRGSPDGKRSSFADKLAFESAGYTPAGPKKKKKKSGGGASDERWAGTPSTTGISGAIPAKVGKGKKKVKKKKPARQRKGIPGSNGKARKYEISEKNALSQELLLVEEHLFAEKSTAKDSKTGGMKADEAIPASNVVDSFSSPTPSATARRKRGADEGVPDGLKKPSARADSSKKGKRRRVGQQSLVMPQNNAILQPCNCKKSRCLKLYCECFAAGSYCMPECKCQNCDNSLAKEPLRRQAIAITMERNPDAFKPKVSRGTSGHRKGCNCKKSACLKKYCECFQGGIHCGPTCKCINCKNFKGSEALAQSMFVPIEERMGTPSTNAVKATDKLTRLGRVSKPKPKPRPRIVVATKPELASPTAPAKSPTPSAVPSKITPSSSSSPASAVFGARKGKAASLSNSMARCVLSYLDAEDSYNASLVSKTFHFISKEGDMKAKRQLSMSK